MKHIAYRGEHGKNDGQTTFHSRSKTISFGSINAANRYATNPNIKGDEATNPRIYKVELDIKNPVISNEADPFIEASDLANTIGEDRCLQILKESIIQLRCTDNWIEFCESRIGKDGSDEKLLEELSISNPGILIESLYIDAYHVFDNDKYVSWFQEKGFDGAIHLGNGATAMEKEYKIFNENQAVILKEITLDKNPLFYFLMQDI